MMTENDYKKFVCIVAGDNPEELLKPFDKSLEVEPYVVYKHKDAKKIHKHYVDVYTAFLKHSHETEDGNEDALISTLEDLKEMDVNDFYRELTSKYTIDEETGDAYSTENPNGHWRYHTIGKIFSVPFITKDGREVFAAKKGEINWDRGDGEVYGKVWDLVIDGKEPENDSEKVLYANMSPHRTYLEKFETREQYITSNTAFWGYAFVSDKTGWIEASEKDEQFTWMENYYNMFIKNLPDDTLLTIYECSK